MFWKKKNARVVGPAPPSERSPGARDVAPISAADELERALDAVAELLRATGRFALEMPDRSALETSALCEQWAQHLLVRAPRPNERDGETKGSARRDFGGAVGFATTLLGEEHDYHEKTLGDFRHAIWDFVSGLHHALAGDVESDTQVKDQLMRLKSAAESASTDILKREAMNVAANIAHALEERRQRQRSYSAELGARVAALGRQLEEAKREGAIDALTQLCNRRAFDEHVEKAVALYGLVDQPVCLVMIDIDFFKRVNDTYGHPVGDEVLRRVAACLVKTFLRRDDFIARYGGEEFAVILRDTRAEDAVTVSERLLKTVRALTFSHEGASFSVTVSAGVARFRPDDSATEWIARADRALYAAKNGGRDQVCEAPSGPPPEPSAP